MFLHLVKVEVSVIEDVSAEHGEERIIFAISHRGQEKGLAKPVHGGFAERFISTDWPTANGAIECILVQVGHRYLVVGITVHDYGVSWMVR